MNNEKFIELEVKFKTEADKLLPFKEILKTFDIQSFFFVEGYDHYFVSEKDPDAFLRYRSEAFDNAGSGQFTIKQKTKEANNIHRVELNIDLINMNEHKATKFAEMMGYKLNFSIYKYCHVYELPDALLCFYTVTEEKSEPLHFIEIEVKESIMDKISVDQGMLIIRYYEEKLSQLGVSPQKRLKKSLFETYRR